MADKDVMIFVEHRGGEVKKITRQLATIGKELAGKTGGKLTAVFAGSGVKGKAADLGKFGVTKVLVADHADLGNYSTEGYVAACAKAIGQEKPAIFLSGATAMGRDLSARLAQRLNTGCLTDCMGLEVNGQGLLEARRPALSGKIHMRLTIPKARPQIASVRPNTFPASPDGSGAAEVADVAGALDGVQIRCKLVELQTKASAKADLTEAERIVSGGRALKAPENFKILNDLADVIGATVGASRAAVDSGYAPHEMQIGQTGRVVNPELYLGFGISGAIQHLAGMRTSKVICAINKDPDAPIFKIADYGIVDDLFKVAPALTDEFKKLLAEG
ncbi:MAG: electron transfer flavoprotein subunit alpha/FixB family protein [Bdellovibrionota bacterium]